MSPRLESILSLLADKPRGLRSEEIRELLCLTPKPVKRALVYLQDIGAIEYVRGGRQGFWVAAKHAAACRVELAEACRRHLIEAERERRVRKYAREREARRVEAQRKRATTPTRPTVRKWPATDAWTPPGPRIPSVWHLPQVLGVA